jgi:hypothetical protein
MVHYQERHSLWVKLTKKDSTLKQERLNNLKKMLLIFKAGLKLRFFYLSLPQNLWVSSAI